MVGTAGGGTVRPEAGSAADDQEVQRLWEAYRQSGDRLLRERLVLAYLPLVQRIASRLAVRLPPQVEQQELVNEGLGGLLQAIDRFDPSRGIRFETFAVPRIQGAMIDGLRALDWAPTRLRQHDRQLRETYAALEAENGRPATDAEVAERLGVPTRTVRQWLTELSRVAVLSLEELGIGGESLGGAALEEMEVADDPLEAVIRKETIEELGRAIEELPERERLIITLLYYEGLTATEVAGLLGVTVSRISQLHSRAVLRIRGKMAARAASAG
ncbi:MAG: FliA/WhiG family RNA polymerase sigma factor [Bacillota bacterium]|nr:FliA/WhiG family RNA polymerase sigma factor [Bacillota bacterium]